jgi:hypothetical protein
VSFKFGGGVDILVCYFYCFVVVVAFKKKKSARLLFEHNYIATVVYMSLVCLTC